MKVINSKGFTLMELLIAIGIFSLVITGSTWFVIHGLRYNNIIWEQLAVQNEGRRAVQNFVDDIRRSEESSLGAYSLAKTDEYEIIFYANIDEDNAKERIHYWLDNGTLKRGITNPTGNPLSYPTADENIVDISHSVVNFQKNVPMFLYFDENYTGAESALTEPVTVIEVRLVKIQLELEKDPNKTPVPLHVESLGQIRNLKMN